MVVKVHPTKFLAMANILVLVWIVANFLANPPLPTLVHLFLPTLANSWATKNFTKILASQILGMTGLG